MSFTKNIPVVAPNMKQNFINSQQPSQNTAANSTTVLAKMNNESTASMVMDKVARPMITAGLGLMYLRLYLGIPIMNMYGVQKAMLYGMSSIVADYAGNFFFSAAKIKKQLGILDIEDMVLEPLIGGITYAIMNKFYLGVNNRILSDFIVGTAINGAAGVGVLMLRMTF